MIARKWLGIALVAGVVAVGSGAAFAKGAPGSATAHRMNGPLSSSFWSAVAQKVGVSASTLETAAESVMQSERAAFKAHAPTHMARMPGGAMGVRARSSLMSAAATYLGISTTTLMSDLKSGESLETITENLASTHPNLSVSGLESALVTAAESNLQTEVDGFVTHSFPTTGWHGAWTSGSGSATSSSSHHTPKKA